MFVCEKCGCKEEKYFGINKGVKYCRRCISFKGEEAEQKKFFFKEKIVPILKYELTKDQKNVSSKVCEALENKKNVLIYAVCGAGKTEIVYESMAHFLSKGLQVGFCIPRKDVVIELEPRIREVFPNVEITSVYGGHNDKLTGDIILLTTHQLFRYVNYFDLLIIDETDAFPFSNNEVLKNIFTNSIRGNYIMMSATPLEWMKKKIKEENGEIFMLMKRHHGHRLIVPQIKIYPFFQFLFVIDRLLIFKKEKKPCLIFCPTIEEAERLFSLLKIFLPNIRCVHSKKVDREYIIKDFKEGKYLFLVTTSVLERGITIKNLQVIVYNSSHSIYNTETLIQISGRVGRKTDAYTGEVLFFAKKPTPFMKEAVDKINEANDYEPL